MTQEISGGPFSNWTDSTDDMIEAAFGIIANAMNVGNPPVDPVPGWHDAAREWCDRYNRWLKKHPEDTCNNCGKPFIEWSAPSPLWNEVMRGGHIGGQELHRGVVCPSCFMAEAERQGIAINWRVTAATITRPLQTTLPDGRVWDETSFLWVHPTEAGQQVSGSTVGGAVTQISGVKGDVTL